MWKAMQSIRASEMMNLVTPDLLSQSYERCRILGVSEDHYKVEKEPFEALDAEHTGSRPHCYETFTRLRMVYRTILGVVRQALQQPTGANFSSITGRPSS